MGKNMSFEKMYKEYVSKKRLSISLVLLSSLITIFISRIVVIDSIRKFIRYILDNNTTLIMYQFGYLLVFIMISIVFKFLRQKFLYKNIFGLVELVEDCSIRNLILFDHSNNSSKVTEIRNVSEEIATKKFNYMLNVIETVFLIIIYTFYVYRIDIYPVVGCYLITIIFLMLSKSSMSKIKDASIQQVEARNLVNSHFWEQINNSETGSFLNPEALFKPMDLSVEDNEKKQILLNKLKNKSRVFGLFAERLTITMYFIYIVIRTRLVPVQLDEATIMILVLPLLAGALFNIPDIITEKKSILGSIKIANKLIREPSNSDNSISMKTGLIGTYEGLTINNLNFKYKDDFQKFSVNIDKMHLQFGEKIYIIGESGSGKSTFLKLCHGQLIPQSGSITYDNENIIINREKMLSKVLYLGEAICLNESVEKNIVLSDAKADQSKLNFVLEQIGLDNRLTDVKSFSMGEKQKLAIARALYHDHTHLLLDEATSAMDRKSETRILELISANQKQKKGLNLIATHNLSLINFTDKVIYFGIDGKYYYGTHKELLNKYGDYSIFFHLEE